MQQITVDVPENFNIFLYGDDHEGTLARHNDGWNTMADMINEDYDGFPNFAVDHGDIIEAIMVDDPRYDAKTSKEGSILDQLYQAQRNRDSFKDKLITILDGNHPRKLQKFGELTEKLCTDLGVQYGTYSAVIKYKCNGKVIFKHHCHHGFGTIRSIAHPAVRRNTNKKISLMNKFASKFGDCVLNSMGHTHQLIILEPEKSLYLTAGHKVRQNYTGSEHTASYIDPNMRWYVNTGSFYKTFLDGVSTYAEIAGYDPVELGFAIVKVRDKKISDIEKVII